jgi:hypothetical protein
MKYEAPALYEATPIVKGVTYYDDKCNGPCKDSSPSQATTSSCGAYEVDE